MQKGFNDLASFYPALAKEWDAEKNGALSPEAVTPASNRKAWWKCPLGHSYSAVISSRALRGSDCPFSFPVASSANTAVGKSVTAMQRISNRDNMRFFIDFPPYVLCLKYLYKARLAAGQILSAVQLLPAVPAQPHLCAPVRE